MKFIFILSLLPALLVATPKSPDSDLLAGSKIPKTVEKVLGPDADKALKIVNSGLQDTINMLLDHALNDFVKSKGDEIPIPDAYEIFSTNAVFVHISGHLNVTKGHLIGIKSLRRSGKATLIRQGLKFSGNCGFTLPLATIRYDRYALKYGSLNAHGTISATIRGLTIDSKISVDYNVHPCKVNLDYLKIEEFGKLDVKITGLGILNSLTSSIATTISKKHKTDVAHTIQDKVSTIIRSQLGKVNCGQFKLK